MNLAGGLTGVFKRVPVPVEECHKVTTRMMLSWMFMAQERTSIPTHIMVFMHSVMQKSTFIYLPTSHHNTSHDNLIVPGWDFPSGLSSPSIRYSKLSWARKSASTFVPPKQ